MNNFNIEKGFLLYSDIIGYEIISTLEVLTHSKIYQLQVFTKGGLKLTVLTSQDEAEVTAYASKISTHLKIETGLTWGKI